MMVRYFLPCLHLAGRVNIPIPRPTLTLFNGPESGTADQTVQPLSKNVRYCPRLWEIQFCREISQRSTQNLASIHIPLLVYFSLWDLRNHEKISSSVLVPAGSTRNGMN